MPVSPRTWFGDRPVATKVLLAVSAVAVVAGTVGVVATTRLSSLEQRAGVLADSNIPSVKAIGVVEADALQTRLDVLNHVVSTDDTIMAKYQKAIDDDDAALDSDVQTYYSTHPAARPQVKQFAQLWGQYRTLRDGKLLPASRANDIKGFETLRDTESLPLTTKAEGLLADAAERETADARASRAAASTTASQGRTTIWLVLVLGLLAGLALAWWASRLITRPLAQVKDVLGSLATGDLSRSVPVTSRDEVGQMAASLNTATSSIRETVTTLSRSALALSSSSEELTGVSGSIAASAEQASSQAEVVAAAAEQVSRNVQTVATGAEEMGASIREIAQNASDAARVASEAVDVAAHTNATVSKLGESSAEIGNVVKVITSIAQQTNLLALNATIEAAPAGEAGRGFAVVANEVKELAQETAKATEDISRRISAIQSDTAGAVEAIGTIGSVIARISDYQNTIASAVEEQTATTNEMSRSVAEAATGSSQIAANISGVAQAASATSSGVVTSQQAADELATMSEELTSLVARFQV